VWSVCETSEVEEPRVEEGGAREDDKGGDDEGDL